MYNAKEIQAIVSGQDPDEVRYNEKAVQDLRRFQEKIQAMGFPPVKFRKLNGILNALEMQIEDFEYDIKVVQYLGNALIRLAEIHGSKQQGIVVSKGLKQFISKLSGQKPGQGFGK